MKRARDIYEQLERMLEYIEIEISSSDDTSSIRKAITSGYFYNMSRITYNQQYKTVKHNQVN